MSRFFRSANSTSSSASESEAEDGDDQLESSETPSGNATNSSAPLGINSLQAPKTPDESAAEWTKDRHRDALLHALLEERCLNEAVASHNHESTPPTKNSPEVKAEAQARYDRLCAQLASYDLISTGLNTDRHAVTRQRYRDGLDLLGQQASAATRAGAPRPRRMITGDENAQDGGDAGLEIATPTEPTVPASLKRLLTNEENTWRRSSSTPTFTPSFSPPFPPGGGAGALALPAIESRYRREYEQMSTLGHGGYGIVYQARHRLDNQVYAVKKVPLSMARLQKIQTNGPSELDELLRELRTLARLNHPNVVRYYTGWIEWSDGDSSALTPNEGQEGFSNAFGAAVSGAEDTGSKRFRRIYTESDEDGGDVVFEDSKALPSPTDVDGSTKAASGPTKEDSSSASSSKSRSQSVGLHSNTCTIESISRSLNTTNIHTTPSGPRFTGPTLALHMQMSLHPMTLADFLAPHAPSTTTTAPPPLAHCFHLPPSLRILLATLDGLAYLHAQNIAHRDVKPANIFLSARPSPSSPRAPPEGCVDLAACPACQAAGTPNPATLEVCIGDFGLVAFAEPGSDDDGAGLGNDVAGGAGTEIYRPPSEMRMPTAVGLDVYAAGVVAFELMRKFGTRMERLQAILGVKKGVWPEGFCEGVGGDVVGCLRGMLGLDGDGSGVGKGVGMLGIAEELKGILKRRESDRG